MKRQRSFYLSIIVVFLFNTGCNLFNQNQKAKNSVMEFEKGTFGHDEKFLEKYYQDLIVLNTKDEKAKIIISPELQGRVMTSTLNGNKGYSFGWINYDLISSGKLNEQFNPVGGEERFWLGPEGGQFAYYFPQGKSFTFENWKVPSPIDTEPFEVTGKTSDRVVFQKDFTLVNFSDYVFKIGVKRTIGLLETPEILQRIDLPGLDVQAVGYETENQLTNIGDQPWTRETGMPSVWLLSMMTPSPEVTVVIPVKDNHANKKEDVVNDNYFGKVEDARLKVIGNTIFFKADGSNRGKIGVSPDNATGVMGSYDAINETLTILQIKPPNSNDPYVNSAWEYQKEPFEGDALNSYNDGPLDDGSQMGPFYELESSSPALSLNPGEDYNHIQRIYHFKGGEGALDSISRKVLNVSINAIKKVF
ncbi:hypothetical protein SAMN04487906_1900 [Zhouia amylolytica]|uniref:Uncharacterized protein n=1 Tax=Zhouia amylolytica TaxID=376730 RepID=A0A1I6T7T9_9FLAO|nr:DUF6786 family protein [Zhouia amylolytica]SFS85203.1 hypothetical protein SAMN04487906_1900 [Zhouia amylolytica]